MAALALAACYLLGTREIVSLFGLPPDPEVREKLLKTGRIVAFLSIVSMLWTGSTVAFVEAFIPDR